ncbi:hypothetical protein ACFL35_19750, partial [Candidatus Riflebacteria bacterium]
VQTSTPSEENGKKRTGKGDFPGKDESLKKAPLKKERDELFYARQLQVRLEFYTYCLRLGYSDLAFPFLRKISPPGPNNPYYRYWEYLIFQGYKNTGNYGKASLYSKNFLVTPLERILVMQKLGRKEEVKKMLLQELDKGQSFRNIQGFISSIDVKDWDLLDGLENFYDKSFRSFLHYFVPQLAFGKKIKFIDFYLLKKKYVASKNLLTIPDEPQAIFEFIIKINTLPPAQQKVYHRAIWSKIEKDGTKWQKLRQVHSLYRTAIIILAQLNKKKEGKKAEKIIAKLKELLQPFPQLRRNIKTLDRLKTQYSSGISSHPGALLDREKLLRQKGDWKALEEFYRSGLTSFSEVKKRNVVYYFILSFIFAGKENDNPWIYNTSVYKRLVEMGDFHLVLLRGLLAEVNGEKLIAQIFD